MNPEEQARLLQEMKDQFIRSVADLLTLKAKVESHVKPGTNGLSAAMPSGAPTMGDYLMDLTRLGVGFYRSLLDLNAAYWEKIAAIPPRNGTAGAAAAAKKEKRPRIVLKATAGPKDEHVAFDVEIKNQSQSEGRFVFFVSDFRPAGEGEPIRPPVKITPGRPLVAAGASERIKIWVPVTNILKPGEKYKGRISVRGPSEAEIVLRVQVLAHVG